MRAIRHTDKDPSEIEIVRVGAVALTGVHGTDRSHVIVRQHEVEHVDVLPDAIGVRGLRQHDDAALDVPADHGLRSGLTVLRADLGQLGDGEQVAAGAAQRAVRLGGCLLYTSPSPRD